MLAPLQLIDYRAAVRSYERFENAEVADKKAVGVALSLQFEGKLDEENDAQRLKLVVRYNQEDDVPEDQRPFIVHRGVISVEGWLRWISEKVAARKDADKLLRANGLAMLYGIARVHIADLTEQGNGRRLLLPSVNFQHVVQQADDE